MVDQTNEHSGSKDLPADVASLVAIGTQQVRAGFADDAIAAFEKAARLQPKNAQLLNNLGYTYQLAGQSDKALKTYEKALRRSPKDILTLTNMGLLQKNIGQSANALATFNRAIAFDPKNTVLLCNRGNIKLEVGNAQGALDDYDQAVKVAPNDPTVRNGRACVLSELMRWDEAQADIDQAVSLRPDYPQAWSNRGDIYRDVGDLEQALSSYQRALEQKPGDSKTLANLAGVSVMIADKPEQAVQDSQNSYVALLRTEYAKNAPFVLRMRATGVSSFRIKHDSGQAKYRAEHGLENDHTEDFIACCTDLLENNQAGPGELMVSDAQLNLMRLYWQHGTTVSCDRVEHCLNPDNDWVELQNRYLAGNPEILAIDNFLSAPALAAMQHYCLASQVWLREYPNQYLGAFANQGFANPLHLQLAQELRTRMPEVFRTYPLNQLWGFKYDTRLGKGINIHADFALVNLNFWITPDQYHLNPGRGGLKVYETPAPTDWTFHDYNTDGESMYAYLDKHGSDSQTIAYQCNRAVLFNSALFHETDEIEFEDSYLGRRINITYLFGRQLG